MGLSACVFKKIGELALTRGDLARIVLVDQQTGELDIKEGSEKPGLYDKLVAKEARLGNIAMIAFLRKTVDQQLGTSAPILLDCVLSSGIAPGHPISGSKLGELKDELRRLRLSIDKAPIDTADKEYVYAFTTDMMDLCEAASERGNAVIFV